MAKIYGEIASSALMTFDKSFSRSNGQPLDSTEVFYSLAAAQAYAATDVAYVGQKIVVIATVDEVTTVTHYGIEADNTLKELGAIPVGDNATIEVVDGKIQLADLDEHTTGTYQPFLVEGKIEWRVPSATTVEGLDSRLTTAEGKIDALEDIVGNAAAEGVEASGLVKSVADNAAAIEAIDEKIGEVAEDKTVVTMISDVEAKIPSNVSALNNDAKYQTDSEVEASIRAAIAEINHAVFQKVDAVPAVADAVANVLYLVPNGDKMDIYAKIGEEMVLIDDTDTDLSGYALKSELHSHANKELLDTYNQSNEDLADAVTKKHAHSFADTDVEDAISKAHEHANKAVINAITVEDVAAWNDAEKNVIASVDEAQFSIDTDRKLTLLEIAISKVTGLQDALDGKAGKGTTIADYGITDAYTKSETLDKIAEKITEINGGESAGEVLGQLNSYKETNDERVDTIEGKLSGIADGAQVNVLEAVKINGVALEIADKAVNIGVASSTVLGVVMSSAAENKIAVAADGTMEVNSLNINKLVQTTGDVLVLDGGASK